MSAYSRTRLVSRAAPQRKHFDGQRFGPKLAPDGGRIFQQSSRDIENLIKKKNLTPEQVEEYYERGILTKWIEAPRERKKARVVPHHSASGWDRFESRRTGLIGRKVGMRREVDLWGNVHPVTLVQIQSNHVLQVKTPEDHQSEGVWSLQVGAGLTKWWKHAKAQIGHFAAVNVPPKEKIVEFRVSENAVVAPGTELLITHFVPGQFVDVSALGKGKGFTGVVKRWGFSGGNRSHGASVNLRQAGSISSGNTSPGRVFKGHPMAGRMGGKRVTIHNLQLLKINTYDNILYIRGNIPGPVKGWVEVKDAPKKPHRQPPPYPTHLPEQQPNRPAQKQKYLRLKYRDPYEKSRQIDWDQKWSEARAALKTAQQGEGEEGAEEEI